MLLDASGKVVSPGFIDLHAHGQSGEANKYQAMDGVTTALELEGGVPRIARFLESRAGDAIIHYGASVSHGGLRLVGIPGVSEAAAGVLEAESTGAELIIEHANLLREANYTGVEDTEAVHEAIATETAGRWTGHRPAPPVLPGRLPHRDLSGSSSLAAELDVPIYTHVRDMVISAVQEVLANALATGALAPHRAPQQLEHASPPDQSRLDQGRPGRGGGRDHRGLPLHRRIQPGSPRRSSTRAGRRSSG